MPISVTCPNCLTRFSVNDKFAGKSGPCPKCKGIIKIPDKSEEVVIHAPTDASPKDSKGKSVIKPIRREDAKLSLPVLVGGGIGILVAVGLALGFGVSQTPPPTLLLAAATLILALPLVIAGYWFLQSDELQGFQGREMWVRCGIVALIFSLTWLIYVFVPHIIGSHTSVAEITPVEMVLFIAAMIALGTAAAVLALELEIGQGVMLFMLYFIVTFLLAWLAGAPLSEFIPGTPRDSTQPGAIQPANPPATADDQPKRPPNLLQ